MADFRKWLYAFAPVALLAGLTVPASAQSTTVCSVQSATDNLVRAQGYAEQVGDVLLACTGGTPTSAGISVPAINIQIFLSQNVTSKITAATSSGTFLESLLIIDEPNSTTSATINGGLANPILNCGASGAPDTTLEGPGVCTIISTNTGGSSPSTYNGTAGHPNVFQGRLPLSGTNSVVFQGVPFDPPGTGVRYLRITNVRVNANGAGATTGLSQAPITMGIASSGQASLQLSFQSLAVATVQSGLSTSALNVTTTFAQCVAQNKSLLTATTVPAYSTTYAPAPTVRFTEGFASAWKPKNLAQTLANDVYTGTASAGSYYYAGTTIAYPTDVNQNVPGVSYNSESGFEFGTTLASPSPNPPTGFGTAVAGGGGLPFADSTTGIATAGVASAGTRLAIALANVPNGLSLYISPVIFLYRQGTTYVTPNADTGLATGVMVLTTTASDGSGSYNPPSGISVGTQPMQAVTVTNGAALIVYEILATDAYSNEYADVPFVVSYATNLSSNAPVGLPQPYVVASYAGGFAPFYSTSAATLASASLPVPRFVFTGTAANLFGIVKCSCNLLFPYVTQAPGYDTGIAVANTTSDPYGTTGQYGAVEFWYYGSLTNGGAAPGTQCTNTQNPGTCPGNTTVGPGQVLTYTLYNGSTQWGLDNRGAGFTGYMIAQAQFQYCHAFAFIGGLGGGPSLSSPTNGLSEGYLALVLDAPLSVSRTGLSNESLGQ